jgi:hypothetical protein
MLDVDVVEDALPLGLLQPRDELRAEDVDLPVQQAPLIGDLVLLLRQVGDELLQIGVGQRVLQPARRPRRGLPRTTSGAAATLRRRGRLRARDPMS